MSSEAMQKALAYLEGHNVMTLATNGADGVWAAAVFYVNDGFSLYFLSAPTTRHGSNIEENARVSVTIQEDYDDWLKIKGIQLGGECHKLEGVGRTEAIQLYSEKFSIIGSGAPKEIAQALSKVEWYKVVPERLFFIDNSLGLGHRDEIFLNGV